MKYLEILPDRVLLLCHHLTNEEIGIVLRVATQACFDHVDISTKEDSKIVEEILFEITKMQLVR